MLSLLLFRFIKVVPIKKVTGIYANLTFRSIPAGSKSIRIMTLPVRQLSIIFLKVTLTFWLLHFDFSGNIHFDPMTPVEPHLYLNKPGAPSDSTCGRDPMIFASCLRVSLLHVTVRCCWLNFLHTSSKVKGISSTRQAARTASCTFSFHGL